MTTTAPLRDVLKPLPGLGSSRPWDKKKIEQGRSAVPSREPYCTAVGDPRCCQGRSSTTLARAPLPAGRGCQPPATPTPRPPSHPAEVLLFAPVPTSPGAFPTSALHLPTQSSRGLTGAPVWRGRGASMGEVPGWPKGGENRGRVPLPGSRFPGAKANKTAQQSSGQSNTPKSGGHIPTPLPSCIPSKEGRKKRIGVFCHLPSSQTDREKGKKNPPKTRDSRVMALGRS